MEEAKEFFMHARITEVEAEEYAVIFRKHLKSHLTLADGVSLLLLRGRIEQLEVKFMVGKLEAVDLKKALNLNKPSDMKDIG